MNPIARSSDAPDHDRTDQLLANAREAWLLTRRQTDVLRLVVQGLSNKEIADALGCAEGTVELHLTMIFRKSGLQGRTRLIASFWQGAFVLAAIEPVARAG